MEINGLGDTVKNEVLKWLIPKYLTSKLFDEIRKVSPTNRSADLS
jgi:hypothetical protein